MSSQQDFSEFYGCYGKKGKFYSCDRYEKLSPLTNRINFIIVNCLEHVHINIMNVRSKTILSMSMYTQIKFS